MKLLHFIKDEKFPDSAYEFFEAEAPGKSTYILPNKHDSIKYLNKIKPVRVSKYAFANKFFIRSLSAYDAIIFHSLDKFSLEIIARLGRKIPIAWIGMGYDYYDIISKNNTANLLMPETARHYKPSKNGEGLLDFLKKQLKKNIYSKSSHKQNIIKKVDLFSPVLHREFLMVKEVVGEPFPEYVRWNYGKIADLVDGRLGTREVVGSNILVGNSASPNNNHIDMFLRLKAVGVPKNSKVVVPLSYGNSDYKKEVIKRGRDCFGEQFLPITEFMEFDKYIDLLASCSNVVMGHLRQQAAGNLFIAIFLGARVFLNAENPLYDELKEMNLDVSDVNSMCKYTLANQLPIEIADRNRDIVKVEKSRKNFERYTRNLIKELMRIKKEKLV